MAVCLVEDSTLSFICCLTANTRKQMSSFPVETINQRCQFNSHVDHIKMDSTMTSQSHESTKRRQINRIHPYITKSERTRTLPVGNICSMQAVSINESQMKEIPTTSIRPKTLHSINSPNNNSKQNFRTCFSHPPIKSTSVFSIDEKFLTINQHNSLPIVTSTTFGSKEIQTKTLDLPKCDQSNFPLSNANNSLTIKFIDSLELSNKLNENIQIIMFDCGSPLRYNENRICNSILLRVSDKISRKRLKTNLKTNFIINIEHLNDSNCIILYDDNLNNDRKLSAGLKCAYEEIQNHLTNKYQSICILKDSFEQFFQHYPKLCQTHSLLSTDNHLHESPSILTNLDFDNYPMTHIMNGLFIGNEANAKNLEQLFSEQIRCIVNVTTHVPLYHIDRFKYCHIPVDDTQKQNLIDYFDEIYTFINNAIKNNENVLVHCAAGISRSPAIVISFLMRYANMSMNDAYELVKRKRSIVSPNLNFMGQLLQYEKQLEEKD